MISCLVYKATLTKLFICCLSSLPAWSVKRNGFVSYIISMCYNNYLYAAFYAHLSTMRSRVRLRRQSIRPFSPSSTFCSQVGHGNSMGGGTSFRLRPGYVPHTGRRTGAEERKEKSGRINIYRWESGCSGSHASEGLRIVRKGKKKCPPDIMYMGHID